MLSVVATARQQNRNVLKLLTACCTARLDGSAALSLLPAAAASAAAEAATCRAEIGQNPPLSPAFSGRFLTILKNLGGGLILLAILTNVATLTLALCARCPTWPGR